MNAKQLVCALLSAVFAAACAPAGYFTEAEMRRENVGQLRMDGELGEILVPENRRVAESRVMTLGFRRIGEDVERPTLFHFTGGPGMSNLKHKFPDAVLGRFNVVEVGYRGIDSSVQLECDEIGRALAADDILSDAGRNRMARAFDGCVQRWTDEGIDLAGYQISDVIEDVEDLRRALGLASVHVVGDSYGTRVALEYLSRHPESVARAVLIGANPPGHFFWSAADVRSGFAAYERATGASGLEEQICAVLSSMPASSMGIRLDPDRIRSVSFFLLFNRSTSRHVLDAFSAAYHEGSYYRLALLSAAYDVVIPRLMDQWGDLLWKGLITDWDPHVDYLAQSSQVPGSFGSPLGEILFGSPYDPSFAGYRDEPRALVVSTPTLVLSGALDFSTPAGNARELTDRFPMVRQVVFPSYGHVDDFWSEPGALGRVLDRFLNGGIVPGVEDMPDRSAEIPRF